MSISQYFRLMDTMARMALRADASRYFLGYLWWLLEPLLFVAVFYVVFELILDTGRGDFLVFLMCGKLAFIWFSKSVNQASNSIPANKGLIGRISGDQTVVFVSHMEKQVREVCNRAICLHKGAILAEGDPAEVLRAYNAIG